MLSSNRRWAMLRLELDKCDLMCANCHQILHSVNKENDMDEIETTPEGGKQARVSYAFHWCHPTAMLILARVMKEGGDKYGVLNWQRVPLEDNINHAIGHLYLFLEGRDEKEDHLAHAFARLLMAVGKRELLESRSNGA